MLLTADRIIHQGHAYAGVGVQINDAGRIVTIAPLAELGQPDVNLRGRVLCAGFVNAHSHAFQRLLRGVSQLGGPAGDTFWSWREAMHATAQKLNPHDLYLTARHAFLEMALHGVTSVGEIHALHYDVGGKPYDSPHAMTDALLYAARDVGIRLSVIFTVFLRGDFGRPLTEPQKRFAAPSLDAACDQFDAAVERIIAFNDARMAWAIAAHSLQAMSPEAVTALKTRLGHMPFHIHVAEQRREVQACLEAHGMGPVALLARSEVCDACTTLVHATHLRPGEAEAVADSGALVCICPTAEADRGDGLAPAGAFWQLGVPMCLGTDGGLQLSMLEEARRLEMHERLRVEERNVLCHGVGDAPATQLLRMATVHGATALGVDAGVIERGRWADFVTFDLEDPSLAGAEDTTLASHLVFSTDSRAVRDVMVGGRFIVQEGKHALQREARQGLRRVLTKVRASG